MPRGFRARVGRAALLLTIAFAACKRDQAAVEEKPAASAAAPEPELLDEDPAPSPPPSPPGANPAGPRYLRPNPKGELVDAFKFRSVPASIVEPEVAAAATRSGAIAVLRRFGLPALAGKSGHVWMAKASLVDRLARERVLTVSFRGEADGDDLRDEDAWIVFLGSTHDDRILKIGEARITTQTPADAPVEIDARELHSSDVDDVVATWSSCAKPSPKACHSLRAWTMQRGRPELIVDVTGDTVPVISGGLYPPHDIVVGGRTLKFDSQQFAYR